jgi:hypothetical protein
MMYHGYEIVDINEDGVVVYDEFDRRHEFAFRSMNLTMIKKLIKIAKNYPELDIYMDILDYWKVHKNMEKNFYKAIKVKAKTVDKENAITLKGEVVGSVLTLL